MKNKYGDEYEFVKVNDSTYTITGDLQYWRYGGKEGHAELDFNDLGFVDPSGGPFIAIGSRIDGKVITRIRIEGEQILFIVES